MFTYILAIDTSNEACSVSLMNNKNDYFERLIVSPREHAKNILPMINDVLNEANIFIKDLKAIAFSKGPGSFTGIRIGLGVAQGLALSNNIPLIGISTLLMLAEYARKKTKISKVLTILNAYSNKFYIAKYQYKDKDYWITKSEEKIADLNEIIDLINQIKGKCVLIGTSYNIIQNFIKKNSFKNIVPIYTFLHAKYMLPIAFHFFLCKKFFSPSLQELTYLSFSLK